MNITGLSQYLLGTEGRPSAKAIVRALVIAGVMTLCVSSSADARVTLVGPDEAAKQGKVFGFSARSTTTLKCRLTTTNPRARRHGYPMQLKARASLLQVRVSYDAMPGRWRVELRCGDQRDHVPTIVGGATGSDDAALFMYMNSEATPDDGLDPRAIPPQLELAGGKASIAPAPDFRVPFACGQRWRGSKYWGQGDALEWSTPNGLGRTVVASADGVAYTLPYKRHNGGYGNAILIAHGNGWTTLYAHLGSYLVPSGSTVQRGQPIGTVGATGSANYAHLHFEERRRGTTVEPRFHSAPAVLGSQRSDNCIPGDQPPKPAPPMLASSPIAVVVLTVDNRVTNGPTMREDVVPVTLSTVPESFCMARGCALRGTERWTGETYATAICQTQGARITNGRDSDPSDDANPDLFASSLYYGVRLDDGTTGYVSEVWTVASQRGGLGLPPC